MTKTKNMNDSESQGSVEAVEVKSANWKKCMKRLIDGVELELRHSAPAKSRADLNKFRVRIGRDHIRRKRKRFQTELGKLLDSDPILHAAGSRFMKKFLIEATKKINVSLRSIRASVKVMKANKLARDRAAS